MRGVGDCWQPFPRPSLLLFRWQVTDALDQLLELEHLSRDLSALQLSEPCEALDSGMGLLLFETVKDFSFQAAWFGIISVKLT